MNKFRFQWDIEKTSIYGMTVEDKAKRYFTNLDIDSLSGKSLLIAGYGKGSELPLLQEQGTQITAIDINQREVPGIHTIQTDILNYTTDAKFDYVYSYGVLHHTPNPRRYFDHLVTFLKPEGKIFVWIYNKQRNGLLRKLKPHRWNNSSLFLVSIVQALVAYPVYLLAHLLLKHRRRNLRSLILRYYDSLCCEHQHIIPSEEIVTWFKEKGLTCKVDGEGYLGHY